MSKILIVEDEKNISKLILDTLALANYELVMMARMLYLK